MREEARAPKSQYSTTTHDVDARSLLCSQKRALGVTGRATELRTRTLCLVPAWLPPAVSPPCDEAGADGAGGLYVRPGQCGWGGRIALGSGAAGGSAVEACGHALQGHRRRAPARPPEDGAVEACGDALQGHRRRAPARPPEGGAGEGGSAPRALRVRGARAPTQARGSGRFISRARSLRKRVVASGLVKMSATFSSPGTNVVLSSFACTSSRT